MGQYNKWSELAADESKVTENAYIWLLKDNWWNMAKEGKVQNWDKKICMNFFGIQVLFLGDPKHVHFFSTTKGVIDKHAGMDIVMPKRLHNNILSIGYSKDQVARRKAMVNAFSGHNLEIMRESIKIIFKEFAENIEKSTIVEHDLRRVVTSFFEKFVAKYIFGKDVSEDKLTVTVYKKDG